MVVHGGGGKTIELWKWWWKEDGRYVVVVEGKQYRNVVVVMVEGRQ